MAASLPYWLWPGDDRPTEEIDDEIEEELRLHLDLLVLDAERQGLEAEEARRRALSRFGDIASLSRRCREIKQGDAPMLRRLQAIATLLLLAAVVFLGVRDWVSANAAVQHMNATTNFLRTIQSDLGELRAELRPAGPSPNAEATQTVAKRVATKADLRGVVTGVDGEPIAEADVLLIVKTWPNNRFRQDDYAVKTDGGGAFVLKGRVPLDGQYGVNAAVVADKHAIRSRYVLVEDPQGQPPEELDFELPASNAIQIVVTDQAGEPLAKALVAPSARLTQDDDEHLVYHQGSRPAWKKTDAEGAVTVDWFVPGDLGKVTIRPRGGDWQERKFDVGEAATVTVAVED